MGVAGAAIATVTAQFIVALVLVISMRKEPVLASQMRVGFLHPYLILKPWWDWISGSNSEYAVLRKSLWSYQVRHCMGGIRRLQSRE